jgi:PAS domain-containing protein
LNWPYIVDNTVVLLIGSTAILVAYRKFSNKLDETRKEVVQAANSTQINGWLHALLSKMPYPAWVKVAQRDPKTGRVSFYMQYMNQSYTDWFGVRREDYIGKTDWDIWTHDVALSYYNNDASVLASQRAQRFTEAIENAPQHAVGRFGHAGQLEIEKVYIEKQGIEAIVGFVRPPTFAVPPREDDAKAGSN